MARSLLKKYVDAEQWDAEDIAGRLGMVLHAAILFAGFQPYGAQPRSGHLLKKKGGSLCLSRQYTTPDLAHRDGADTAVLMLCAQGCDVALLVFLTTTNSDDAPENMYLERLDLGIVRPLLSRSLRGVEPWASWICKSLADGICWGFLDELCRRNGLPLSGFESLPDDLKGAVLEKLTDGKDLAKVECVSSQLRLLVADRDHKLWKALYKALLGRQGRGRWDLLWFIFADCENSDEEETISLGSSWKKKFAGARWRCYPMPRLWFFNDLDPNRMIPRRDLSSRPLEDWLFRFRTISRRDMSSRPLEYRSFRFRHPSEEQQEEEMVATRFSRSSGHRHKLARNDCKKKWRGGGAIHSPSSRYRWKHR